MREIWANGDSKLQLIGLSCVKGLAVKNLMIMVHWYFRNMFCSGTPGEVLGEEYRSLSSVGKIMS